MSIITKHWIWFTRSLHALTEFSYTYLLITGMSFINSFKRSKNCATWSEKSLAAAVTTVHSGLTSVRKTSTWYGIPRSILNERIKSGKTDKRLGRHATFTQEQERDIVNRLIRLSVKPQMIRLEAFVFSQEFNIPNRFNKKTVLAGTKWLWLFLQRNL